MEKEHLLDLLMKQEIIFDGKKERQTLKKTDEFRTLYFISEHPNCLKQELVDNLSTSKPISLILNNLIGDGLIIDDNGKYSLNELLHN